jgi:DNA-binding XRE family transcriptional regulator
LESPRRDDGPLSRLRTRRRTRPDTARARYATPDAAHLVAPCEGFAPAGLIGARAHAGLTQEQLAERMGTRQVVVARWEGGKVLPSTRTLARIAKATGTRLQISFAQDDQQPERI